MIEFYKNSLKKLPDFCEIIDATVAGDLPTLVNGLSDIHKGVFASVLFKEVGKKILIITPDDKSAVVMAEDINALLGEERAVFYPARDFIFKDTLGVSRETGQVRVSILAKLIEGKIDIVTACADAAASITAKEEAVAENTFEISEGMNISISQLTEKFIFASYTKRDFVDGICQYSVRGGIIDFYSPVLSKPIRVEMWGDSVDTVSSFNIESQRREDTLKSVKVVPASELLYSSKTKLIESLKAVISGARGKNKETLEKHINADIESFEQTGEFGSPDKYLPLCYGGTPTLFDFFADDLIVISEHIGCKERITTSYTRLAEDVTQLYGEGILSSQLGEYMVSYADLIAKFKQNILFFESFITSLSGIKLKKLIGVDLVSGSPWSGDIKFLKTEIDDFLDIQRCIVIYGGTEKSAKILASDLKEDGYNAHFKKDLTTPIEGEIYVVGGLLSAGFEVPEIGLTVISFKKSGVKTSKKKRAKRTAKERIKSLEDLARGDFLVHVNHGIGVFEGIHKIEMSGITKDYIKIAFKGKDVLYLPVTQLDLISKYIGPSENGRVKINKLGGDAWKKTKIRVRAAAKNMAAELLELYARRAATKGHGFSEDDDLQRDFDSRFPYDETDDQLRSIEEIKRDMEKPHPMDRLLCGDVGFGKTEVALRAMFKCVADGKQCVVLVPTTILAWQHYQNFLKRFEAFPINIELMSRFVTKKKQNEVVAGIESGVVDIVVGTHRLVQKDIKFKNLGLVVVDEEQRFGVAHKERFKASFPGVDMLTLSATPIPRTLNMAMSGIRDMSIIEQPPMDRTPVQTYVMEYSKQVVNDAIIKELRRGGQVFYMHNRVETIDAVAGKIMADFPDAVIGVAHGKMGEEKLSKVWEQLLNNQVDVLVCTSIIETGVDVPNCNTLIIENADRLGLAQLYQIRGRVGRSSRRAYAYLTFKRGKVVSELSAKRLNAIREFTNFGSGFKIAMRDLEIRGAGSILSGAQSGHMEAVGYDMYLSLLGDATAELKGEDVQTKSRECVVDIRIDAHIPEGYIDSVPARIDVYRKIASVRSDTEAEDVFDELIDRFGDPPPAVSGLVRVALLRNIAAKSGIREINQKADKLLFYLDTIDMELMGKMAGAMSGRFMLSAGAKPYFTVKILGSSTPLDTIKETLNHLSEIKN